MRIFYDDGLKDCSWIPDTYGEFKRKYANATVEVVEGCCIVITVTDGNTTYLDTIYVLKEHRGKGIGKKVLERLTKDTRTILFCNKALEDFYKELGFKPASELAFSVMVKL